VPVTGHTVAIVSGRNITLQALAHVLQTGQQPWATRADKLRPACQHPKPGDMTS
jgi:hypothetical protein